jgi:tRNA (guanosine-2'-O-)-methyltransferase
MAMTNEEILHYFQDFLSDHKIELFEKLANERTRHVTFILEDLFHPHNASAILRTCDCFGIQDVHMVENNHQFVNERDISLGSAKWLSIEHYNDVDYADPSCIKQLKARGYTIAALNPHENDVMLSDLPLNKTAFVLGAEKNGLSDYSLKEADVHVKVPMHGFTESYNVSVTAALVMYEMTQRLRNSEIDWRISPEEQWEVKLAWTLKTIRSSRDIVRHFLKKFPDHSSSFPFSKYR